MPPALFRDIVENCADGIVVITEDGRISFLNRAAEELFGRPLRRALGQPVEILMPKEFRANHIRHMQAFRDSGEPARRMGDRLLRTHGLRADGHEFPTDISIMASESETGPVYIAIVRDISEQVEMERRLEALANTDPLTGVSNRRAFLARAEQEFAAARRYRVPLSAAMIDIDRFKQLNDKYGHLAGDRALISVARQLCGTLRKPDIFARWGGEEFICLLPHTEADVARQAGERLRQGIEKLPLADSGIEDSSLTVSVGVASLADGDDVIDALINRADQALYAAKARGRNKVMLQHTDNGRNGAQSAA
jgi:diguanylate cyclase (GGDEF)-like protein/PAS domain S-box-containing protein